MRNHTTPHYHELVSQQGKRPTLTPGNPGPTVSFLATAMPTGEDRKFWYYVMSIVLKVVVRINQTGDGSAINANKLWKLVQSVQIQSPLLGMLAVHSNSRGSVLGNILQYLGYGFSGTPLARDIPAAAGDTDVTLYFRVPLSWEFLKKPHESAPWSGFLEGSTFEVMFAPDTVLAGDSAGATLTAPSNCRAWMEMIPVPEAIIHTPCHWREHRNIPGGTDRHIIQDMGSPDGLQGVDTSKGVGLAALYQLMNPAGLGLAGSGTADNILQFDTPWRRQNRVEIPDAPYLSMFAQQGPHGRTTDNLISVTSSRNEFPYSLAANVGALNDAESLVFPICTPARDQETSKFQTVSGAKEINYAFTSVPEGTSRYLGLYFPVFEESFMLRLAAQISPGGTKQLVAKTLNKAAGVMHGVGKAAYTRAKVVTR